jgi:hypothetical protein
MTNNFHLSESRRTTVGFVAILEQISLTCQPMAALGFLKERRLIEAWAELHQGELLEDWQRLQDGQLPYKIAQVRFARNGAIILGKLAICPTVPAPVENVTVTFEESPMFRTLEWFVP